MVSDVDTSLGVVRYWRTYLRGDDGQGFHPLDAALIDSKGAPTATDTELARRRQKRRPKKAKVSQRQRGRDKRARHGSKPRRKKGDKSKNARLATMVVQYTLQQIDGKLHGPINKRVYASFAPKRHAFEFARREADKRGFTKESGKLHQLLTDGDEVLAAYAKDYLPEALHTIDVMHVIEYLWKAGECLYKEGSEALNLWMSDAKTCSALAELTSSWPTCAPSGAVSQRRALATRGGGDALRASSSTSRSALTR